VVQGIQGVFAINGLISKMIFDKNKDKHAFYVEESFPMDWYYPHAEPFGLCLKINKEPLSRITPEMMAKDRQYWDTYTAKLTNQWRYGPNNSRSKFLEDRPANMSYSKLRLSVANIYSWRAIQPVTSPEDRTALFAEAEYAYRQALAMAPSNSEAAFRLADMLINLGRFDDSKKVLAAFAKEDPHNPQTPRLEAEVDRRRQLYEERMRLEPAVRSGQAGLPDKLRLMQVCQQMNDRGAVLVLADMVIADPALTADVARQLAGFFFQGQMYDKTVNLLQRLVQLAPTDPQVPRMFLDIAALQVMLGQSKEAVSSLQRAVKQGGEPIRQAAVADQRLGAIRGLPEVQRLLGQPAMPPAGGADVFGLPAFSPAAPGGAPAPAPGK
jgi:tetratricopeptide (TPR) repeat protein